jgi:DnaK suppressor protein
VNARQRTRYKTLLEKKREELAIGFNAARDRGVRGSGEGDKDYIDHAVSSYTKEFLLSLSDLERAQLVDVEDAIKSIDAGEFGDCSECEDEIEKKRLEAVPWALYCLTCQDLSDRGLLDTGDE